MADTVHEFHNASSSLSALQSGVNIATTTGSQTAVIREIQFNNPNSKSLEVKIGDFSIGTTSDNTGFTGKELLKASQSITLSTTDSALWTGLRRQNGFSSTSATFDITFKSDHYFSPPTSDTVIGSENGWSQRNLQNGGGEPPTNPSAWGNAMEYFDGENQFSKPAGDYYYCRWCGSQKNNRGNNNQLYYYDYSADSSTQLVGTSSQAYGWYGKWSNKYLVRFQQPQDAYADRYWAVDTTDNSVYKSNVQFTRAFDTNTTSERNVEAFEIGKQTICCLDNLILVQGQPYRSNGQRMANLINIDDGKYITWPAHYSTSDRTKGMSSNDRSRQHYDSPMALCRGEDGTYYILNVFFSDGSGANKAGIECMSLGKTPATTYLSHGSPSGYNGDSTRPPLVWYYDIHAAGITDFTEFRATTNTSGYRDGMSANFFPLKKITATDSKSRYWIYMATKHTILIDLNQTTGTAACTRFKFNSSFAGTSAGTDQYYPWGDITDTGNELFADNTGPIYDTTVANDAWGTVGCRVTGILST